MYSRGANAALPLIRLENHARHVVRCHAVLAQAFFEKGERRIFGAETVGEGNLNESRIQVDDPVLERGNAARLLRAERTPVKCALIGDDDVLVAPAVLHAICAAELDGALHRLGARGEQENLLEPFRQHRGKPLHQPRANFAREAVVGQEPPPGLRRDRLDDLRAAVSRIAHEHARRPVNPLIAPGIEDLEAFGPVPHDRGLALHGQGLVFLERVQDRQGLRHRDGRDDPSVVCVDCHKSLFYAPSIDRPTNAGRLRPGWACYNRGRVTCMDSELLALAPIWYVTFLLSLTVHEAAHALVAKWGGDPTAFHGGQVTLNPLPHILREPFGTIVVPLITYFYLMRGWMMGWASAPYDPIWQRRYPRRAAWMALAGPAGNFTLVLLAGVAMKIGLAAGVFVPPQALHFTQVVGANGQISEGFAVFLSILFSLNVLLGAFNLLPVPPLDGVSAIGIFLPERLALKFAELSRNQMFSMLGLLIAWQAFGPVFGPVYRFALQTLYLGYTF